VLARAWKQLDSYVLFDLACVIYRCRTIVCVFDVEGMLMNVLEEVLRKIDFDLYFVWAEIETCLTVFFVMILEEFMLRFFVAGNLFLCVHVEFFF